jgi:signal transduction histidine kinase/ligand-binding sensor domain-containing protein
MRCVWRTVAGLVCAAVCAPQLSALNPAYRISQYLHTAWKGDSGLQAVRRLAQTPDGYLWLATRGGLVRFDGVRFTNYRAGSVPGLENSTAQDLLVDPDGSLWVATLGGGISHYQQGIFRSYTTRDGLPSDDVQSLYRDTRGVMWMATRDGKIARLVQGRFEKFSLGIQVGAITGFAETADQSLWISTFGNGVFRLRDGVITKFSVADGLPDARVSGLCRDRSGMIWTAGWKGVSFWDGKRFVRDSAINKSLEYAIGCREDRDGNLWIAASSGLFRAQKDTVVKLDRSSGLSSDFTSDVFEDRDGNLWVATRGGLDRLRDGPLRSFTTKEGLAGDSGPIVVGDSGAIWTISGGQVDRIAANELSTWRVALPARAQPVTLLSQPGSELLIGLGDGVVRWRLHGGTTTIPELAGLDVRCMLQAHDGSIWIGTGNRGLLRWKPSPGTGASLESVIPDNWIATLAEDHAGAMWAGSFFGGGLYRVNGGKVQHFGHAEGLKSTYVYVLFVDEKGDLWLGSPGGLSWFQNGTLHTAGSQQGLPSDQVFAIVDDSYGRIWVTTYAGIASLERKSLTEWAAGQRDRLNPTVYRATDEMQIYTVGRTFPNSARSGDGHLWFAFADGVTEVTPPVPGVSQADDFPVLIEDVRIDGVSHSRQDRLRIPTGARSIEITYTAIALANPESVRFRYRLTGMDPGWVNADARRVAFYDNLKPGSYTFTVAASSGAGQWRQALPVVMEQLPFFYQTTWFAVLVVTTFLSLCILYYRFRVQQAVNRIQAAFQERIDERARIARGLHDTLLQSFQGVVLKFETVKYFMRSRPDEAEETLKRTIDQARAAILEGRDAVHGLRSSTMVANDLAPAITTFGGGLAADQADPSCPEFRVHIEGKSRDLSPLVRDEVYHVACEAVRNAFQHAHAQRIEVEIGYNPRQFRLRVVDNGKGIDPAVLSAGGRAGHHGLPGIRERAELAGGKLSVRSRLDSGTEIELTIPGSIAYTKSPPDRPSMALGRGTG